MAHKRAAAICYACSIELTPANESKEHILPNAIGGRLKSNRLLCKTCNNSFGEKYESDFVEELQFFSSRLPIKRDRGENRDFRTIDRVTGLPVVIDEQGKVTLAHVVMLDKPDPIKGGKFRVMAPDEASARKVVDRYREKFPNAKIDVDVLPTPKPEKEYIEIAGGFGSLSFFKTAQKCLLNLYMHEGGDRKHIEREAIELFTGETEPTMWFYSDSQSRSPSMKLLHVMVIFGRPEESLLFGYAEFFGAVRLIGILNDDYQGPPVYFTHSVDPLAGSILKCDVSVGLNREQIVSLVKDKTFNSVDISAQLGAAESALKNNHYFSNLIDGVFQKTILKGENKGKTITAEMINEVTQEMVKALMPNILEASKKRRADAERDFKEQAAAGTDAFEKGIKE